MQITKSLTIDDLAITNNSWLEYERNEAIEDDVKGYGNISKYLKAKIPRDVLHVDDDVEDYDSDVEFMNASFV